jgi:hypothetical protein
MKLASRKLAQLPLISQNGRWSMRFRGKRAEFVDRRSALRAAILEAFQHSRNGTPTQVVCIDDRLAIEIVWTYGVDPDPPGGLADQPPSSGRRTRSPTSRHAQRPARAGAVSH